LGRGDGGRISKPDTLRHDARSAMKTTGRSRSKRWTQSKATLFALIAVLVIIALTRILPSLIPRSMSSALANPTANMDKEFYIRGEVLETAKFPIPMGEMICALVKDGSGQGWVLERNAPMPQKGDFLRKKVRVDVNPSRKALKGADYVFMVVGK